MISIAGWLFDAYPKGDKMVFWIKHDGGRNIRLEDNRWSHSIYVPADNKQKIMTLIKEDPVVKDQGFMEEYEKITGNSKSEVLKLTLKDSAQAESLAKQIMRQWQQITMMQSLVLLCNSKLRKFRHRALFLPQSAIDK